MTDRNPNFGGPRPGAGRPTEQGERRQRRTVMLTSRDWSQLKTVGDGNASEGVRRLLRDTSRDTDPGEPV